MGFSLEDWINRQISGFEAHPVRDSLEAAGIGAAVALPFLAPEIGAGIGGLFGADAAGVGAADLGLGAADAGALAADAGAGAADIGAGAADIGAGAVDTGLAAADVGGLGAGAAEALAGAGSGAADLGALGGSLGTEVGADASNALAFAPDAAGGATSDAVSAIGNVAVPAAPGGEFIDPVTAAGGVDPNIAAAEGAPASASTSAADVAGPTTKEAIAAGSPVQNLNSPFGAAPADPSTAASAAPTAAPAAASPGITSQLGSALNSPWTKAAELALPLGFLGYNVAKGPPPIPAQAQQAVNNAQAQASQLAPQATQNVPLFNQTAATDLTEATNNQISPSQAAILQKQEQNAINQRYQFYASHGVTDPNSDSRFLGDVDQIKQDTLAQQNAMIQQLISTAFQSSTAANAGLSTANNINSSANNALMQAAQLQVQGDTAFNASVGDALKSFGLLAAVSSQGGKTSPVQTAAVQQAEG